MTSGRTILPRFLRRFPAVPGKKQFIRLEEKVTRDYIKQKYSELLSSYNTFYLYNWILDPDEFRINRDYIWQEFNDSKKGTVYPLKRRLKKSIFEKSIGLPFIGWNHELRASFQSINALDDIILRTSNRLSPYGIGIRIDERHIEGIAEIEPLLEESQNMYKNLNYQKLLDIARQNRRNNTETNQSKQSAKLFLEQLAQNKVLLPAISPDKKWLVLTRETK